MNLYKTIRLKRIKHLIHHLEIQIQEETKEKNELVFKYPTSENERTDLVLSAIVISFFLVLNLAALLFDTWELLLYSLSMTFLVTITTYFGIESKKRQKEALAKELLEQGKDLAELHEAMFELKREQKELHTRKCENKPNSKPTVPVSRHIHQKPPRRPSRLINRQLMNSNNSKTPKWHDTVTPTEVLRSETIPDHSRCIICFLDLSESTLVKYPCCSLYIHLTHILHRDGKQDVCPHCSEFSQPLIVMNTV